MNKRISDLVKMRRRKSMDEKEFIGEVVTELSCNLFDAGLTKAEARAVAADLVLSIKFDNWE